MSEVIPYLQMLSDTYKSMGSTRTMYDILLAHGRHFTPAKRPSKVPKMKIKECYANATRLALSYSNLTYCEGFALYAGLFPVQHAWVVGDNGVVIDPTWSPVGVEYFGIPFDEEYLLSAMKKSNYYGIMDNFQWREFIEHTAEQFIYKGSIENASSPKESQPHQASAINFTGGFVI